MLYGDQEQLEVSESWRHERDISTTDPVSAAVQEEDHFCKRILYKEIQNSRCDEKYFPTIIIAFVQKFWNENIPLSFFTSTR